LGRNGFWRKSGRIVHISAEALCPDCVISVSVAVPISRDSPSFGHIGLSFFAYYGIIRTVFS